MKIIKVQLSSPLGLQIYPPNFYLPIHDRIDYEKPKWGVRKIKKATFPAYPYVILATLWLIFYIYYAFVLYTQISCVILFFLVTGWMCSYLFDRRN